MSDMVLTLIVLVVALLSATILGISIVIDTICIWRERVLTFMEKHFPKYYYYDYEEDERFK